MDYATLLPADNNGSGFDNLAETLFVSPVTMERYLDSARKISRLAVGDPNIGLMVNIHLTPVRQPQEARNEDLPFGTRGGTASTGISRWTANTNFRSKSRGPSATHISWKSASTGSARDWWPFEPARRATIPTLRLRRMPRPPGLA